VPDGRNIVFVAGTPAAYKIWLRVVAAVAATPIPGTDGGTFPFWSPDSRFIGFFAGGKLKKVQVTGGTPIVLCDAPGGRGGSWSRDNVILFNASPTGSGLFRVPSAGGQPTVVTALDPATGEASHRWPHFLPDGRRFLYTATTGICCPPAKPSKIRVASLDSSEPAIDLFQVESAVSYASGHLLFARDETLMAQPFDPDARQLKGDASPLAEHVGTEGSRYVAASASENGTLVYAHDISQAQQQLTWFDRAGTVLGTLGEPAAWVNLSLSPDERRVAVAQRTDNSDNLDIYIIDITRNVTSRLTADPGIDASPVWSPDGTSVVFEGQRSGKFSIRQKPINGTADESLLEGSFALLPTSWSADGRFIAYIRRRRRTPRATSGSSRRSAIANRFRSCRPRSSTSRLCSLRMDAGLRTHRAKAVSGRHRSTSTFSRFPSPAGATRFRGAVAAIRSGEPTAKSSCTSARTRP
jgi:eukaryotic-like serine/threonine-protein kinase